MRSTVRLSIHASDKAFTAPKLNLIAIEKLLGPCKGLRVISAFESPVPEEMPVRPDSVGSILFHPEAPGLWLADSARSARLGIAPPSVYGTKRPAFNSMICRIPRGTTTHGKTPRLPECPALGFSAPVRIDSHADSEGFGTMLARSAVRDQLRGDISRDWKPEGLTIRFSVAKDRITVK